MGNWAGTLIRAALALGLTTVALTGCGEKAPQQAAPDKPDVAAGKAIAETTCVGCHGLDGKGATGDIPNLAAQAEKYLVDSLHAYKEGKREHAALKDMTTPMSDADMRNVAAYYAGQPPLPVSAEQQMISPYEKGESASGACATCHGKDGNSTQPGTPSLAGQQPTYFVNAVQAYRDGKRQMIEGKKVAMLSAMNQVDVEAMALYYASQTPAQRTAPKAGDPKKGEPLSAECGSCHGAAGVSSKADIPSLAGQDALYLTNAIKAYRGTARQQEDMHRFLGKVSDADIASIAAYYSVQASKAAEGERLSIQDLAAKCDRCHGPGVENAAIVYPKIHGQNKGYLVKSLRYYRDNSRDSSMMHNMSSPYSEAVIDAIAAWYASQPAR
jgi:cytochrome c553